MNTSRQQEAHWAAELGAAFVWAAVAILGAALTLFFQGATWLILKVKSRRKQGSNDAPIAQSTPPSTVGAALQEESHETAMSRGYGAQRRHERREAAMAAGQPGAGLVATHAVFSEDENDEVVTFEELDNIHREQMIAGFTGHGVQSDVTLHPDQHGMVDG